MIGCFSEMRKEFSSDQKLFSSRCELQLRKLPLVLLAAALQACPGNAAAQRLIFNPHVALVFLIGQPNECKRNLCAGSVSSLQTEVSILKNAHSQDYFRATAFGTQHQTQR